MLTKTELHTHIENALENVTGLRIKASLQRSSDPSHGDYTTNIAMLVAKQVQIQPFQLAEQIVLELQNQKMSEITKIEVVKPGFVNFFLSTNFFISQLEVLLKDQKKIVNSTKFSEKKIMIEFTDPNPFKEFHIGHLYNNIVGESVSRLLEACGAEVKRVCYQGDVGLHVAKALWGMQQKIETLKHVENGTLKEKAKFLGEAYALGVKGYEEDIQVKEQIIAINKQVYAQDPAIDNLYVTGRNWSLEYFSSIYERLGTTFGKFYFESEVAEEGMNIVKQHLNDGIFKESEGAIVFMGEEYGLHTRVFINQLGLPTYEAKELSLAGIKYKDFAYDQSIIITANEINAYFKVLLKVLSLISPDLAKKTCHISHGIVKLPTGKMSSRSGNVVTGEWLLDVAVIKAKEKITSIKTEPHQAFDLDKDSVSEQVGVGAVKYAMLKHGIGRDIIFDFDDAVSFEGNSGPYLQYTYVRTQSILRKAESIRLRKGNLADYQFNVEEISLLRKLASFEETVTEAAITYRPHLVCTYLFDLAQSFNGFYQKHTVLGDKTSRDFRLRLTTGVGTVIKNGLQLLGIAVPERM